MSYCRANELWARAGGGTGFGPGFVAKGVADLVDDGLYDLPGFLGKVLESGAFFFSQGYLKRLRRSRHRAFRNGCPVLCIRMVVRLSR